METATQAVKSAIRSTLAQAFFHSRLHRMRGRGKVVILTYHRVLAESELNRYPVQPGMYVLNHVFERHIEYLRSAFEIVPFSELLSLWKGGEWQHDRHYCVITFDDGWRDNYDYAFPILKKHDVPATIFLPTDYIGSNRWFWPEQLAYLLHHLWDSRLDEKKRREAWSCLTDAFGPQPSWFDAPNRVPMGSTQDVVDLIIEHSKRLSPGHIGNIIDRLSSVLQVTIPDAKLLMGWNEVAEMSQARITFGSHSCSHRLLTNIPLSEVRAELDESLGRLKENAVNLAPVFCYPNGNTNHAIQSLVRDAGYLAAVGVEKGTEGPEPGNLFHLRRVSIHNDIAFSIPLLAFHLFGPLN
jgi:peptidoglycan/xylan/chitin deacetylase (PgdA/CDA1 family)